MSQKTPQLICDAISILTATEILDSNGHFSIRDQTGRFWINTGTLSRVRLLGTAKAIEPRDWPSYRVTLNNPTLFQKCWNFYLRMRG